MKTPEQLYASLGNRGEYCTDPHISLEELRHVYDEGAKAMEESRDLWIQRAGDEAQEANRLLTALKRIGAMDVTDSVTLANAVAHEAINAHWERQRKSAPSPAQTPQA